MNPALCLLAVVAAFAAAAYLLEARPTRRGVVCVLALAAVSATTLLIEAAWIVAAAADVVLVAAALIDLRSLPRASDFRVERQTPRTISLLRRHVVRLIVEYAGETPLALRLRDGPAPELGAESPEFELQTPPRSRAELEYAFTPGRRGRYEFDAVYLQAPSRFGLWMRMLRLPLPDVVQVYPNLRQLDDYAILARCDRLSMMGVRRIRRPGHEDDFERLRDYTPDDEFRHIDWRSTARRNQLIVREFRSTRRQRLMLALDCGRMMTNETDDGLTLFDHALNSALLLSYVALRQGDEVGVVCFSDEVHSLVPPAGGSGQMNRVLHATFDQFPRMVESRPQAAMLQLQQRRMRRALLVCYSNLADVAAAERLQAAFSVVARQHLPLGVFLRDPHIFQAMQPDQIESAPERAAAAASVVHWRWSVLRGLRRSGVLLLDESPDRLAPGLVNEYLEIKARGRL